MIGSVIFWSLASICNAVMDKTNHHYSKSIFKKWDPLWWDGEISWKNKYINGNPSLGFKKLFPNVGGLLGKINYPVQLTDAWHFFKTLMIIFLTLSVISFDSSCNIFLFIIYGFVWNFWFNLFYNHILPSKK